MVKVKIHMSRTSCQYVNSIQVLTKRESQFFQDDSKHENTTHPARGWIVQQASLQYHFAILNFSTHSASSWLA